MANCKTTTVKKVKVVCGKWKRGNNIKIYVCHVTQWNESHSRIISEFEIILFM
jgi:hypothetical protein